MPNFLYDARLFHFKEHLQSRKLTQDRCSSFVKKQTLFFYALMQIVITCFSLWYYIMFSGIVRNLVSFLVEEALITHFFPQF